MSQAEFDYSVTLTINWWLPVAMLDPYIGWQAIQEFTSGQTYASSRSHIHIHIYKNKNWHLPKKNVVINSSKARFSYRLLRQVNLKYKNTRNLPKNNNDNKMAIGMS
jgi:hypothetical protein